MTIRPEDEVSLIRNNVAGYLDLGFDLTDKWFLDVAGRVFTVVYLMGTL